MTGVPSPTESTAGPPGPFRSLRRRLLLAFAPLGLVLLGGTWCIVREVGRMHLDVQRMFEESREVEAAQTIVEALKGIRQWSDVGDPMPVATLDLVARDVDRHLDEAEQALTSVRSSHPDDPSRAGHQSEELRLAASLDQHLQRLRAALAQHDQRARLRDVVGAARHEAEALAAILRRESRAVGDDLDQRSEDIVRLSWSIGIAALLSLAAAAVLFARLVLRPLAELDRSAEELGRGDLQHVPVPRRNDELGRVAVTFSRMADSLQRSQEDLEQRIEQRSRELLSTARLADIGTMAAGVAHEINNPLASIAACAEGLLRDAAQVAGMPESMRKYLRIVRTEAMRASDITRRLLLLAHQDGAQRQPLHLDAELREVAAMFHHEAEQSGVRLDLQEVAPLPAIEGDRAEWRQVLFNLLRNALEASPRGGVIRLRCAAADGGIRLAIEDEGPGLPAGDPQRLFEPFVTTKAPGKGTGLGLAIVHRIVTAHGGRIVARDREAGGAAFEVTLPAGGRGTGSFCPD